MGNEYPFQMRVKVRDRQKRTYGQIKNKLGISLYVKAEKDGIEFIVGATTQEGLEAARGKLDATGLEEVAGDVTLVEPLRIATKKPTSAGLESRSQSVEKFQPKTAQPLTLQKKPYGFVAVPKITNASAPIWHDGHSSDEGLFSGEIRYELQTLTPLLVGWERQTVSDEEAAWPIRRGRPDSHGLADVDVGSETVRAGHDKTVLCSLRAPGKPGPVLIPGDSIKGLLRAELGALLGAPMERVAERSYSYRPNSRPRKKDKPRLIARVARVDETIDCELNPEEPNGSRIRVPLKLSLLSADLEYWKTDEYKKPPSGFYRFDRGGQPYRGGMGAGINLNQRRRPHQTLRVDPNQPTAEVEVLPDIREAYIRTVIHLTDGKNGHFSARHPDIPKMFSSDELIGGVLDSATKRAFRKGDLIWVEWDLKNEKIVSFGWHYYYRWAYVDTVRKKCWTIDRSNLIPLPSEFSKYANGAPQALSAVRRLFGYTGDGEGSKGIGERDYTQLMGRISINTALEVVTSKDCSDNRFLKPTFLRELGMPRPSAVEHYLQQPPNPPRQDAAYLATYGDALGYDEPGELAGRKFYLDQEDAYSKQRWLDDSVDNRVSSRSTLAVDASQPGRLFRFTLRFRDLEPDEVAAVLAAMSPHQFRAELGGDHTQGYCSKLGYARPLGWGSVRMTAKSLLLLDTSKKGPKLEPQPESDMGGRVAEFAKKPPVSLQSWLAIHRCKHPDAADYPRGDNGTIYGYHSHIRAEHSFYRRYNRKGPK